MLFRTSVYDSRARERWRQIEEQKALALQLQSQVREQLLNEQSLSRNFKPQSRKLDWEENGKNLLSHSQWLCYFSLLWQSAQEHCGQAECCPFPHLLEQLAP